MLYKTQGIIIKKSDLGEYDKLITVYSKDFGKLILKGKAVRKNQAKLKGHLELFLCSHLMIAPGKGFDIITGAEAIESFPFLRQNINCLFAASYFSELIDKMIIGPEKDDNIWKMLLSSFQELNQKKEIKPTINNFENRLSEFLGYGKQENFISFVESFVNDKIDSHKLLTEYL